MVNANARKLTTLDSVFNVARDCESNIKAIEAAERAAHNYNPRRDNSNDDSKSFNNRSNPSNSYGRQNKPTSDPHVNVNRISTLYAPLESGPIPREATVSSSIYTEDLPAGNPSSLSDASGLESPPISVITETVPPPYSAATDGPEIIEARSMTSAVLTVVNTSWTVPVTVDDGADFSLMGFNHLENFKDLAVPQSPIQFRVANDNLATCSTTCYVISRFIPKRGI